eukprot:TRINITY_DN6054_c0_g1_i1.p1 TRINITY_DN6054_c0_g1~~TRINITY_DN6054_c0_g1_i1.p1  ORF type:complete len:337 (-),score=91.73 TRINITY_DN6054_c0_g1_i1:114-1124(-)
MENSNFKEYIVVSHTNYHHNNSSTELSFDIGDRFSVLEVTNETYLFVKSLKDNKEGYVPKSYVDKELNAQEKKEIEVLDGLIYSDTAETIKLTNQINGINILIKKDKKNETNLKHQIGELQHSLDRHKAKRELLMSRKDIVIYDHVPHRDSLHYQLETVKNTLNHLFNDKNSLKMKSQKAIDNKIQEELTKLEIQIHIKQEEKKRLLKYLEHPTTVYKQTLELVEKSKDQLPKESNHSNDSNNNNNNNKNEVQDNESPIIEEKVKDDQPNGDEVVGDSDDVEQSPAKQKKIASSKTPISVYLYGCSIIGWILFFSLIISIVLYEKVKIYFLDSSQN